jgi:DNA-binding FrmR family transcriptional regulator
VNEFKAPAGPTPGRSEQLLLASHLTRIEGQLRGIQRMIEAPRHCVEILQQLAAARAALERVIIDVFRMQVEETMGPEAVQNGHDPRQALADMLELVEKYSTLARMAK